MLRCNTYPILSYADFSSTYGRFFKTLEEDKERERIKNEKREKQLRIMSKKRSSNLENLLADMQLWNQVLM